MTDNNEVANEKARKRQEAKSKIMAEKTIEKGLIIVHTGNGKGKSTAAFGMAMRAIHQKMKLGIVQFIKGKWQSGERDILERYTDLVEIKAMGEGFTWNTQDRERDIKMAEAAWAEAKRMILDSTYKMIILDEINIALRYDYLPIADVVGTLQQKPLMTHVVLTGRNAKPELIECADLVTEMTMIKHPFRAGVKAQAGIEF